MKEFICTWSIENFSYSWHRNQNYINSQSFVADTLENTVWSWRLYPRGNLPMAGRDFDNFLSLYLFRHGFGSTVSTFGYEFSCLSANNLILTSVSPKCLESVQKYSKQQGVGCRAFLQRSEVFGQRKDLYLPHYTLTLRCRIWKYEVDDDQFGQSFCRTRLEIERIVSIADMNPTITREKTILIHSKNQNKLLMTINVSQEKENLRVRFGTINSALMKFCTLKFSALGRNRTPINYMDSWLKMPVGVVWTMPIGNNSSFRSKLKLTCEFVYSTGEETNSVVMVRPCSFKFPEFSTNSILSCIPSGKLSDCPSIYKDLWDLYSKHILCDVELKTQSASFWVHKVVLSARSPVFLAMFTAEMMEKTSSFVDIQDLEDDTLEKFISFLYTNNFEESQWNAVAELYYAADKYQVNRLKSFCSSFFVNNMDDQNVCDLLILADRHNDSDLKSKAESYVLKHQECIFRSLTWKQFSEKQPLLAVRIMLCKYDNLKRTNGMLKTLLINVRQGNEIFSKAQLGLPNYSNALEDFRSLYQSQALSDIVIQTASATFPAHKAMLSAGSCALRSIITLGESANSLKMKHLDHDTVSRLLLFLYTDSLGDINWEDATKLYRAAVAYKIERLKVKCSCFFLENLRASNAVDLLKLAQKHRDVKLKSIAEDFISLHDREITLPEGWSETRKTDLPRRMETRMSKRLKLENNSC